MTVENSPDMSSCLEDQPIDKGPPSTVCPLAELPPEYPDETTTFVPCPICQRTFSPSALSRHEKVCVKLSCKKRHVFDSTKQRSDHLQDILPGVRSSRDNSRDQKAKNKSRWREKRAEFLRAIRAAKGDSDENDENDGGRRPSIPSDYVQCQHCQRYFGPKAADRHIAWCEEQKTRMPRMHTSEDAVATQRLKTRTKYIPPKPGQNGWRAPKKKDVISSIPPPNAGANITPPGRLISPPPPTIRHVSPPPISPSRRGSSASLPPGPPRYASGSLGRHAGRQFSSLLQSVTGYNPGYGTSSGYGSSALYGSPSGHHANNSPFNRSASLRLPRRRQSSQRMARHRDLASDMMASVCIGGKAKRGEPEGDEAQNTHDFSFDTYENNIKHDDAPYDPFSAAELQFQALFGPQNSGRGLKGSGLLGSTSSLKTVGLRKGSNRDYSPGLLRNRSSSISGDYFTLCSLGLDNDLNPHELKSPGGDSSELENSPKELLSPEEEFENIMSRFSPIRNSKNEKSRQGNSSRNLSLLKDSNSIRVSPNRTTNSTYNPSPRRSPTRFSNSFTSPETKFPRISPPRTNRSLEESLEFKYNPSRNLSYNLGSTYNSNRLSPSRPNYSDSLYRHSPSPECKGFSGTGGSYLSPGSKSPTRFRSSLSPTPFESNVRKPGDGSLLKKSPSPVQTYTQSFENKIRESSPYQTQKSTLDFQLKPLDGDNSKSPNHFAWTKQFDSQSPPTNYSRHFGGRSARELTLGGKQAFSTPSPQDSIKI